MNRTLPDSKEEPTITVERAAAVLGLGRRTAYAAVERGEIPAIRVGRCVRVLTARFLAQYELTPTNSEAAPATGTAAASILKDTTCDSKPSGNLAA